ncbi:cytochrome P460 family protein [Pseudomonas sp. HTZ1]|uniref:cytochrome P460 family protein n=2 Tax=unclassified Pseudomonas TaxID=196821 RepID=UPI0028808783|nr:cytochrome P460 family protein [Pseudomonas sp. HTZ1]
MRVVRPLLAVLAGLFMIVVVNVYGQSDMRSPYGESTAAIVDDKGNMQVPSNYRTTYQVLGTWAVAADGSPGSKEMHVVYASPGTIAAYRKAGHFPDGTVLVKEVFKTTTKPMTTGTVSSAGTLAGWFVMVKDDVGRYPNNKLWGDGWGWAWFEATDPKNTSSTDHKLDCQGCHVPAQASDWIYTHGYPPLSQ